MPKLKKIGGLFAATAASAALLLGGTAVVPEASPVLAPAPAAAGGGDLVPLVIENYNHNGKELHVCTGWSGDRYRNDCPSRVIRLKPKERSDQVKDGVRDADGAHVPVGYKLMEYTYYPRSGRTVVKTIRGCVTSKPWTKVSPTLFDSYYRLRLVKC